MSARVLLNLLNKLGKRDKMRGLPSFLSLFRNEFNKFNNTRVCLFVALHPKSTAMVIAGRSVHLTTLFSWAGLNKRLTSNFVHILSLVTDNNPS